jgi:hypothetical protein
VLLIDEYDPPIHAGDAHGSCDQAIELLRNLLSGRLPHGHPRRVGGRRLRACLRIPGRAVLGIHESTVIDWLDTGLSRRERAVDRLLQALLSGGADRPRDRAAPVLQAALVDADPTRGHGAPSARTHRAAHDDGAPRALHASRPLPAAARTLDALPAPSLRGHARPAP